MYATTKEFLDYFNLKRIDELPPLSELTDLDAIDTQLEMSMPRPGEESTPDNEEAAAESAEGNNASEGEETSEPIDAEFADEVSEQAETSGNVTLH